LTVCYYHSWSGCNADHVQVAAENDVSLRGHCADLENIIANLHRQLDLQASRLTEHVAASQRASEQTEQHIGQLMADMDDLRAQLKVCRLCDLDFAHYVFILEMSGNVFFSPTPSYSQLSINCPFRFPLPGLTRFFSRSQSHWLFPFRPSANPIL